MSPSKRNYVDLLALSAHGGKVLLPVQYAVIFAGGMQPSHFIWGIKFLNFIFPWEQGLICNL